jgi:hypothetical protein
MANKDLNPQGGVQGTSALYKYNSSPNTRAAVSQKVRILTPAYGGDAGLLYQIGVVSSFSAGSSARGADPIRGIGFGDQIAELVPGVTDPVSLSMERTLLYLSNGHQAMGYAGGIDGPVRTLQHHRWPFDVEQQLVFSSIADTEAPSSSNVKGLRDIDFSGQNATGSSRYNAGEVEDGAVDPNNQTRALVGTAGTGQKHKAIITYFEGCWITDIGFGDVAADSSIISQSMTVSVTDVHDLFSTYGEFMSTGNDPTIGQGASILYTDPGIALTRNEGVTNVAGTGNVTPVVGEAQT